MPKVPARLSPEIGRFARKKLHEPMSDIARDYANRNTDRNCDAVF